MKHVDEYISPPEFEKLISYADNSRDKVLLTLIYNTGRRVSEVVRSLKAKDISMKTPNIYFNILKKKQKQQVWIRVSEDTIQMMREYIKANEIEPDEYIFPIARCRVDQIIKVMGAKAGMLNYQSRKIHVHMLRHSFAVNRARKCKNMMQLKSLQMELQHSSIDMTSYYMEHFAEEDEVPE